MTAFLAGDCRRPVIYCCNSPLAIICSRAFIVLCQNKIKGKQRSHHVNHVTFMFINPSMRNQYPLVNESTNHCDPSQTQLGGIILNDSRGLISLSQQVRSLCAPSPEQAPEVLVWIYRNVTFASESWSRKRDCKCSFVCCY